MTAAEAFAITPADRARLDAAPFLGTDEDGWRAFASAIHEQVLTGYAQGEMEFRRVFEVMRSCSLLCRLNDRITLLALTVERALSITPKKRRRLQNPEWVRNSAAELVKMLREERDDEKLDTVLSDAVQWLIALGIFAAARPVSTGTLHNWYLTHKHAVGDPILKGRPRDRR